MHPETEYLKALKDILETGEQRPDRTGVGTVSKFGVQMKFNLREGFPAITTKKLAWKAVLSELLWFISGSGDERKLKEILHGDINSNEKTI
jgi:thymidylate synthase